MSLRMHVLCTDPIERDGWWKHLSAGHSSKHSGEVESELAAEDALRRRCENNGQLWMQRLAVRHSANCALPRRTTGPAAINASVA